MIEEKISWTDRLRDRGFVDQWGFAFFAGIGSAGIFAAKYFAIDAQWVVAGAIAAMFVYALIIARKGGGRLAADQAGDNCYYLGLIYTLTSLSFAIIFFDPNDTTTTIIQGFGVALGTTIAGLILRVFFNQGRPDLENVEERARLELTEATSQLTTELSQSATIMKDFARQITQSLGEVRDEAAGQLRDFIANATSELRLVVDTANEAITTQADDFANRSTRYTATFDGLLEKLGQHTARIDAMSGAFAALTESTQAIRTSADAAREGVQALTQSADATRTNLAEANSLSAQTRDLLAGLSAQLASLQNAVTEFQSEANSKLAELTVAPGEAVTSAARAVTEAAARLDAQMTSLAEAQATASSSITTHSESARALVERNNRSLEEHLGRSRDLYARVFDGLAAITDDLAKRAEAQR